ncbi:MAG: hypothetical protein IKY43_04295 [Bacteroidales bacterium]|nr:hypothetical protein [Bacteroidales bacterium]
MFKKGFRAVVDSFKVADKNCVKMLLSMEILCVMVVLHIELRMINRQKKAAKNNNLSSFAKALNAYSRCSASRNCLYIVYVI